MDSLSRFYTGLRGPAGQPQSAETTIDKLCDRLANSTVPEDRRAALLGLKGLSRDWKAEVGTSAIPILLDVLQREAFEDNETGKAVLETLNILCEEDEAANTSAGRYAREHGPGARNSERFLSDERPMHALIALLRSQHFYVRYFSLQLFGTLLGNKAEAVQKYVLTAPGGLGRLVEILEDKREIVRNEGLLLIISLSSTNADIQKIISFEGAFDKLFAIIDREGGIAAGGIVVQDCLAAIVGLLRYNVSNQNYFRETSCIQLIAPLLLFPPPNVLATPDSSEAQQALAAFAMQLWSEQKITNAQHVLTLVGLLVGGAGEGRAANQKAMHQSGLTHCLAELALASNAPSDIKAHSLLALADVIRSSPQNQDLISELFVSPLIPVPPTFIEPGTNPEFAEPEWLRAEPVLATLALVALAIEGDPGLPGNASLGREGLRVRAAATSAFEAYVYGNPEAQLAVASGMAPTPMSNGKEVDPPPATAGAVLLSGLRTIPVVSPGIPFDSHGPVFSALIFGHLVRNTESCKRLAREISLGEEGTDDRVSLIHHIVGNLMMAQREQSQGSTSAEGAALAVEWSRVMVAYLVTLCVWCWESPKSVREFLDEGANLQVLIQPITQASGVDPVVQGLCAFLLGILYEYNREPGDITRAKLQPILNSRVGPDQFVSRILRLREDPRFKNVGPDVMEIRGEGLDDQYALEEGIWFDWAFIEFLKNNYLPVQRAILQDPGSAAGARPLGDSAEAEEMVSNLRSTIATQNKDLDALQDKLATTEADHEEERKALGRELISHREQLEAARSQIKAFDEHVAQLEAAARAVEEEAVQLREELAQAQSKSHALEADVRDLTTAKEEAEKEQEDLLVLLEDLSNKRREDKARMRQAQLEVSDDEEELEPQEEQPES
ncbi:uncharacterized protein L969DRAFT_91217 [Mixia osmundae IAM 14324]|uniref:Vesicle tethering protein Uso1/P115-like head domain-containing protein n=1 Tax=Mixia osmundae (strain CBS 9802 / IAM 14324 / JCM 22182 / KY 12970) TaxID=764103 RepID=G7DWQ0_MIXOS|nr:uncharacterized protein L969DRAFT_91217 [Mixia osmundae IAM 14324]KEI36224.1 hypothetical protein L969DRAFT_91217 [Mixia osmundae IAM 14324]GAA94997.1 hypothetical protein E5Q_01652 [Mixia osmundae IAM 14324]